MKSPPRLSTPRQCTLRSPMQSPSRSRPRPTSPAAPAAIHYPTDAKSPARAAITRSRKASMAVLLGVLSFVSLVTNLVVWYGNPLSRQYNPAHYGLEGGRPHSMRTTDPAWNPVRRRRDGEARWIFGEGRMGRPMRRRDEAGESDRRKGASLKYQHNNRNASSPAPFEGPGGKEDNQSKREHDDRPAKGRERRDRPPDSRTKGGRDNLSGKPGRRADAGHYKRQQFMPHPIRKESRSPPWGNLTLPGPTEPIKLNRLVLLEGSSRDVPASRESAELEDWLAPDEKNSEVEEEDLAMRSETVVWEEGQDCVPMSEWQTTFHPTCNSIHEMDISLLLHDSAFSLVSSKGHWRNAWRVDLAIAAANGSVNTNSTVSLGSAKSAKGQNITAASMDKYAVLKSLKYVHEPNEEVFELSRVDAVSLDVLTKSRFTINIHGFCGSSSIQEFAGGDLKGLLPKLDPIDKLRYAAWVAEGVADVHAVDSLDSSGANQSGNTGNGTDASLIHNDLNMDNILLGARDGVAMPILNDFNIAVFRRKESKTGQPCKFRGRFANPQWMSPEQQERENDELSTGYLDEKIDVYALGNILFKVVAGNSPWKYDYNTTRITPDIKAKIARAKLRGAKPKVPPGARNATDPSIKAVLAAMNRCYRNDNSLRPSAKEVADFLNSKLEATATV